MSEALTPNAGDRKTVRRADSRLKDRARLEQAHWQASLKTADGRFVLWQILAHCGLMGSTFNPNALVMAHRAGQQDAAHWLVGKMNEHDPQAFDLMMKEGRERDRSEKELNRAAHEERQKEKQDDPLSQEDSTHA